MHGTIELPALRRAADILPSTLNEGDRSIEVVWSTGSRVRRQPLFGEPFDEELSMDAGNVRLERLNAGAPLLKVHELRTLDAVIGSAFITTAAGVAPGAGPSGRTSAADTAKTPTNQNPAASAHPRLLCFIGRGTLRRFRRIG